MNPRLFEENYSYSLMAKKLGCSKTWVGKWAKRWKTNPSESLQSQSRRRLADKTALYNRSKNYSRKQNQRGYRLRKLERNFKGNNCREVGSRYSDSWVTSFSRDVSNGRKFHDLLPSTNSAEYISPKVQRHYELVSTYVHLRVAF